MNDLKNKYVSRSYSKQQLQVLWHYFEKMEASKQNLSNAVKEEISRATNISSKSITSWFHYQRKCKEGSKTETSIDVDAFEPNSQMNASILAKIYKYNVLKGQVDFLLQQVEILKKDLDASKRYLDESNSSLNDSGFDTSNNSFNSSINGQIVSSQVTPQYNVQNTNVQRFGFQSQPNGIQKVAGGTSHQRNGAQNLPNGAQNLPNGAQNLPNGAQNLPNGAQNLPNGAQNLPNGAQNLPNGAQNLPNGAQHLHNGYQMGYNMNPMFYHPHQPQQYLNHFNQMPFNGIKQEPLPYTMDHNVTMVKQEPLPYNMPIDQSNSVTLDFSTEMGSIKLY